MKIFPLMARPSGTRMASARKIHIKNGHINRDAIRTQGNRNEWDATYAKAE